MAKRFFKKRSRSRSYGFARKSRRSSSSGVSLMNNVVLPMAYGASRATLSNFAQPITSKVPLGNYADEAVFGIAGYLLAKKTSGTMKEIGKAVLMIESASLGSQLVGTIGPSTNSGFYM